jgi:soluble lytic murein transglycosylase
MLTTVTLLLAVSTADPRPALVKLQLAGRPREALAQVSRDLSQPPPAGEAEGEKSDPSTAHRVGLDYLRGHLLDLAGEPARAGQAFAAAMSSTPALALHARYRMALDQERMGHPEVTAGLVASVVDGKPSPPLLTDAVRLLTRSIAGGGDCRLLHGLEPEKFPVRERRTLLLAEGDCALRSGVRELARNFYLKLLEESRDDDPGRVAAERLAGLVSEQERGRAPMLLGLAFQQHRDFERALRHLRLALGGNGALSENEAIEARYAQARAHFWQQRYSAAATLFGELAERARTPAERARALYQQARCHELIGQWTLAGTGFRRAFRTDIKGELAAPSLLAALRLDWRGGREEAATEIYSILLTRREWREPTFRAALFLTASDVVRGRRDRAGRWLSQAIPESPEDRIELAYWRGRLAELDKNAPEAVAAYLEALRLDLWHPLAQAALRRLAAPALLPTARVQGRRLGTQQRDSAALYGAWLLLGSGDPEGLAARRQLRELLLKERTAAPFLRLHQVPVENWPIWEKSLDKPEEMLLALGIWGEGGTAVRAHFPPSEPALAYTGSLLLARGGDPERSILQAEALRQRLPARVPLALLTRSFRQLLYPLPYQNIIVTQSRLRGVDPDLLAAIIREESRFDRDALSPAAARGLAQLTVPTARQVAAQIDIGRIDPEDLYRPDISAALGASYLGTLLKAFRGSDFMAVAAYNAGEPQARLWRSYCYSPEMEELFTKVGFRETRAYLRRVLTSRAHYAELY